MGGSCPTGQVEVSILILRPAVSDRVSNMRLNGISDASRPEGDVPPSLLVDCRAIMQELGVRRATAERIMRWCSVKVPLGRRVYVYRADVVRVLQSREVRDAP
jgi:hypothetical protein